MTFESSVSLQSEAIIDFEEAGRFRQQLEQLEDEITRTAGHINAIDYYFIKSFAHWLNWKCGLGQLEAREKVRVARCLRTLPLIDAAFRTGEISYSKVRAITRVANPDNEECLLYIARNGTAQHVELAVRRYRRCRSLDDEGGRTPQDKGFSYFQDTDGMYVFQGRLPAEEGAVVVKAIDRMVDQIRCEKVAAQKELSPDTGKKDGGQDSEGNGEGNDKGDSEKNGESAAKKEKNGGFVSAVTFTTYDAQPDFLSNRASALVAVAEHFLATAKDGASVLDGSDKYHVVLHINANPAHLDHKIAGGPACYLDTGHFLAPEVARQLACTAAITTVTENDDGDVLHIGRRSRQIPRAIGLAVKIRDQGCCYPSCHQQKYCDAHHIQHWADGGETSVDNLVSLCRHHHTLLHKGEYQIERQGKDIVFTNKHGKRLVRAFNPQFPGNLSPKEARQQIAAQHKQLGLAIDETTVIPGWRGETFDYDTFIQEMYRLMRIP
jgi:hypothetical protein